jgi:superfamily II RNA helicase
VDEQDPASPVAASARTAVVQTMAQLGFADAAQKIAAEMLDSKHKKQKEEFEEEVEDLCKSFRSKLSVYSKSSPHFQLQHLGHLLPRPPPKIKDPRITTFTPDEWQRELLDAVDNRDSVLVCAPTSSGKTFISHYCMDKVMHDTKYKDGVVVFVAPTKALINQIAAQVYGSFHSAFGIYTDAYRHRALTCRILITVPECLESLLMSPVNAGDFPLLLSSSPPFLLLSSLSFTLKPKATNPPCQPGTVHPEHLSHKLIPRHPTLQNISAIN